MPTDVLERRRGRPPRRDAGFFSTSFWQPVGPRIAPGEVRGYYIDFRVKIDAPEWPPARLEPLAERMPVAIAQWGLGAYERYLDDGREQWLAAAAAAAEHLLRSQRRGGPLDGGFVHERPYPHTFLVHPPWVSGMAQGEAASLLVRLHLATGDDRFADAARRALRPLSVPSSQGGACAVLGDRPLPEEYPTEPPSFVLNGAIYGLWGQYDVGAGLGDDGAQQAFAEGVETLSANLHRWDLGWWSRYDLYPHRATNVASLAYHELHVHQLEAMALIAPRPEISGTSARFRAYAGSPLRRARAVAAKARFRAMVPRRGMARRQWRRPR